VVTISCENPHKTPEACDGRVDSEGGDSGIWCVSEGFYESRDSPHGKTEVG
jgi:hypothetical protein